MDEVFNQLDELLSDGESKEASDLFNSLPMDDQELYIQKRYSDFCNFSECGNWLDGVEPTIDEVRDDLIYLIKLGNKL